MGAEELHRKIGHIILVRPRWICFTGIGPLAGLACEEAKASGFNPQVAYKYGSSQEARNIVSGLVRKNDTILIKRFPGLCGLRKYLNNTDNH